MARAVYSTQFIVYTSATPNLSYEVEEGFTAVMRDAASAQDIGGYVLQVGFQNSPEAPACFPVAVGAAGVANYAQWTGRIVVPGGGTILAALSELGDAPYVYVGGYLLRND